METHRTKKAEKVGERIKRIENLEDLLFANVYTDNVNEYAENEEKLRRIFDEAINLD